MANVVGDIAIQIGADIGPLVRELVKASGAVDAFGAKTSGGMSRGMKAATVAGAAMATTVLAVGAALGTLTMRSMESIDALSKQARAVGISVASFQAMAQVAQEAGVESDALSKILIKMQDNLAALGNGSASQVEAFGKLGLTFQQLQGLGADEQFLRIAQALEGVSDPAERTAAALDLFGKGGAGAVNMLGDYGAAVKEAAQWQREFGLAVSDVDAKNIEAANDAMGRISIAAGTLGTQLAVTFAPAIEAVSIGLTQMIKDLTQADTALEKTFGSEWVAQAILGAETFNKLNENAALLAQNSEAVGTLQGFVAGLATEAQDAEEAVFDLGATLRRLGDSGGADVLAVAAKMENLRQKFESGQISADEFMTGLREAAAEAQRLMDAAAAVDGVNLSYVRGQVAGLIAVLQRATGAAIALRSNLASGSGLVAGASASGAATLKFSYAPETSPRPQAAPNDIDFDIADPGDGGGGGGSDDFAADLERLQQRFGSEAEIQIAAYEEQQALLDEALARKAISQEQYYALSEQMAQEHNQKMSDIDVWRYGTGLEKAEAFFGGMADALQSGNERMQAIGKKFAAIEALMNAWRAFNQVLADPRVPAYAKIPQGLAVLGAAMNAVKAIGGGGGGGARANQAAAVAAPSAPQNVVNVSWYGAVDPGSTGSLTKKLNEEFRQGYTLNIEFMGA